MADGRIAVGAALSEKLRILADAAKYDVACTSSGTARRGNGSGLFHVPHIHGGAFSCGGRRTADAAQVYLV